MNQNDRSERHAVVDRCGRQQVPRKPTAAPPGADKLTVLAERARRGLSLWHPDDAPADPESLHL